MTKYLSNREIKKLKEEAEKDPRNAFVRDASGKMVSSKRLARDHAAEKILSKPKRK